MIPNLRDKTAIVTGATNGIGLVTARELAKQGINVVIISRSQERCEFIVSQLKKETGNPSIEFLASDLSVMANVRQVAHEFMKRHNRLDILVNNAGAIFFQRLVSQDGYEMTFALNHLSYFLLTVLLLDTLKSSAPSRIINVSSDAHQGGKINLDDLMLTRKFSAFGAYSASKLANILFTYQLDEILSGTQVTANALHPGFVATGFAKNNSGIIKLGMGITSLFARKPEKGAETSIFLASSPEVEGVSGKYFSDCREIKSSTSSYDKLTQKGLWEKSLELTENR
ncbi:MAG: SDR family oxidoreductase [Anaerolineaceae bacterium]|nr:SDR family oxidoreductase [Anaerolineaceae bacterium]